MIFDTLANLEMYASVVPQITTVAQAMDHDDVYDLCRGHYTTFDKNVTYDVIEYKTCDSDQRFTFHKNKTIVEIVLSGTELFSTTWRELCSQAEIYDKNTDTGFISAEPISAFQGAQGRFAVFLPGEPYKSGVSAGTDEPVKKVVFTIVENL